MILTRRVFSGAALAALLVAAGSFSSALAGTPVPFSAEAFKAAQASDNPILVEIHADWCPTCKAQDPILDKLTADPKFKNLVVFRVDFDEMKPVVQVADQILSYVGTSDSSASRAVPPRSGGSPTRR